MMIVTRRSAKRRHVWIWLIALVVIAGGIGITPFTANFEWPQRRSTRRQRR